MQNISKETIAHQVLSEYFADHLIKFNSNIFMIDTLQDKVIKREKKVKEAINSMLSKKTLKPVKTILKMAITICSGLFQQ